MGQGGGKLQRFAVFGVWDHGVVVLRQPSIVLQLPQDVIWAETTFPGDRLPFSLPPKLTHPVHLHVERRAKPEVVSWAQKEREQRHESGRMQHLGAKA